MHLMKIILELKKKPKSNACMKIFDLPKILQDQHFFFHIHVLYVLSGILDVAGTYSA